MGVKLAPEQRAVDWAMGVSRTSKPGTGYKLHTGAFRDEYLPEWSFERRARTIERMITDPQVAGHRDIYKIPLQEAEWFIKPASESTRDKEVAAFVAAVMLRKGPREYWTATSWLQRLGEICDGLLDWGFALFYKERTFIKTGELGPKDVISRWTFLEPETIQEWVIENGDRWLGVKRSYWRPDGTWLEGEELDAKNLSLFVFNTRGGKPEGRAKIRPLYRAWHLKDIAERMEAIDMQRRGAPMPFGKYSRHEPGSSEKDMMEKALRLLTGESPERAWVTYGPDNEMGYVEPAGHVKDAQPMITRKVLDMADAMQTGFTKLGQTATGARAVAEPMIRFAMLPLNCLGRWICTVANEGSFGQPGDIPELCDMNYPGLKLYPTICFKNVNPLEHTESVPVMVEMLNGNALDKDPEVAWPLQAELIERTGFRVPKWLEERAQNPEKYAQEARDEQERLRKQEMGLDENGKPVNKVGDPDDDDPEDAPLKKKVKNEAYENKSSLLRSPELRRLLMKQMNRWGMKIPEGFSVYFADKDDLEKDVEEAGALPNGAKLGDAGGRPQHGFFRAPSPFEQRFIELSQISTGLTRLENRFFAVLMETQKRCTDELIDKVARGILHSGNVSKLGKPGGPVVASRYYSRVDMRKLYREGIRFGRNTLAGELVRQTARRETAAKLKIPQGDKALGVTLANSEAEVTLALDTVVGALTQQFIEELLSQSRQGVETSEIVAVLEAVLGSLKGRTAQRESRKLAGLTFNQGRNVEIQLREDQIAFVVRSEVLDEQTCAPCSYLDSRKFLVNTPEYWENMPPAKCEGTIQCRGFYYAVGR